MICQSTTSAGKLLLPWPLQQLAMLLGDLAEGDFRALLRGVHFHCHFHLGGYAAGGGRGLNDFAIPRGLSFFKTI